MAKSSGKIDLLIIFIVVFSLFYFWAARGGIERVEQGANKTQPIVKAELKTSQPVSQKKTSADETDPTKSAYYGKINISQVRPHDRSGPLSEEYLILSASRSNKNPINISGWKLQNSVDYVEEGRRLLATRVSSVTIPEGKRLPSVSYGSVGLVPISISPGGKAVISSGSAPAVAKRFITTSFLLNKCVGYLKDADYVFRPQVSTDCSLPKEEIGAKAQSGACVDFISRLRRCHIPKVTEDEEEGRLVDGKKIGSLCLAYLQEHFNYESCVKYHLRDSDFYTKEWRVFLNQNWPLWDQDDDTITLYDNLGKIVDVYEY